MRVLLYFLILTMLVSCAVGAGYAPAPEPPAGKALLYLVRSAVTYGGGYRTEFSANDRIIASLYDGGYSWIYLDAGSYKLKAGNADLNFKVDLVAGETYYIRYRQVVKPDKYAVQVYDIFERLSLEQAKQDLLKARYKPSNDYHSAKFTKLRDYQNTPSVNAARMHLKRRQNIASTSSRVDMNVYLIDDAEKCFYSRQKITHESFADGNVYLPTDGPVTLLLTAQQASTFFIKSGVQPYFCSSYITFYPETGQQLSLDFSASNDSASQIIKCHVSMTDMSSGKSYPFLPRTKVKTFSGASPRCTPNDMTNPQKLSEYSFGFVMN